jgi:hypothetical protein
MEQFDRNIFLFGSLNRFQQHASLSIAEIRQSLSLSSLNQEPKSKKINFYTKMKLKKY